MKEKIVVFVFGVLFALTGCTSVPLPAEQHLSVEVFLSTGGFLAEEDGVDADLLPFLHKASFSNRTDESFFLTISREDGLEYALEYRVSDDSPWTKGFQPDFEWATSSVEVPPCSVMPLPIRTPLPLVKFHHRLLFMALRRSASELVPAYTLIVYPDEPEKTELFPVLP